MGTTPDWLRGGEADPSPPDSDGLSILGVIAWIAGIAVIADVLFLAHHFLG